MVCRNLNTSETVHGAMVFDDGLNAVAKEGSGMAEQKEYLSCSELDCPYFGTFRTDFRLLGCILYIFIAYESRIDSFVFFFSWHRAASSIRILLSGESMF